MITINLEKELLKQNKTILNKQETILLNSYEKYENIINSETLCNLGLNNNIIKGNLIKKDIERENNIIKKFNQERVFHISQIEKICNKYYLKFLPVYFYKGEIDFDLPVKISTFEITYGIKTETNNTFIVAPKESFKLQEKPKDPLMFCKISENYYYLIHKWGNDLTIFRKLKILFSKKLFTALVVTPIVYIIWILFSEEEKMPSFIKKNNWKSEYDD